MVIFVKCTNGGHCKDEASAATHNACLAVIALLALVTLSPYAASKVQSIECQGWNMGERKMWMRKLNEGVDVSPNVGGTREIWDVY